MPGDDDFLKGILGRVVVSEDLQKAYDQLNILFVNYKRKDLKDEEQLQAALETYKDNELREISRAVEEKMTGFEFRSRDIKSGDPRKEEFDREWKEAAQFCDKVDKLINDIITTRKVRS